MCRSTGTLQVLHLGTCYFLRGYPGRSRRLHLRGLLVNGLGHRRHGRRHGRLIFNWPCENLSAPWTRTAVRTVREHGLFGAWSSPGLRLFRSSWDSSTHSREFRSRRQRAWQRWPAVLPKCMRHSPSSSRSYSRWQRLSFWAGRSLQDMGYVPCSRRSPSVGADCFSFFMA